MSYFNQNPPMPGQQGAVPPPGYSQPAASYQVPPSGYLGPPQPQVVVNQAPAPTAQPHDSSTSKGLLAGCLAGLGVCCCLEMCC